MVLYYIKKNKSIVKVSELNAKMAYEIGRVMDPF
jgi:hypothetical protein